MLAAIAYSLGWVVVDIGVRAGWLPDVIGGWDAASLFRSIGFWQEVAFFSSTLFWMIGFWLLLRRSALVLPVFLLGFVLYRIDSFLLTLNHFFDGLGGFETFSPVFAGHLLLLLALIQLNSEGVFDRDKGKLPGF